MEAPQGAAWLGEAGLGLAWQGKAWHGKVLFMVEKKIIQKVWENKQNKQKLITIPAKSKIKKGDYVEIKKIN